MAKLFRLKVNTPEGTLFEDDVLQVEIKTPNGMVGFLAEHQPSIGSILPSVCYIRDGKGERVSAVVNTGIYKMDGKQINIITDFFYFTDKINQSIFEIRKSKIQEAIKNKDIHNIKVYEGIQRKLQNELEELAKLSKKS
jgi:F0F1-type ATP synthase epsilon subunit